VRCRTLGCIPDFSAQLATYVGDWHQTDERERQLIFQPIALTLYAGSELGSGIIPRTVFVAKELKPTYGRLPQPRRILFLMLRQFAALAGRKASTVHRFTTQGM
jgi:hypothetical protein